MPPKGSSSRPILDEAAGGEPEEKSVDGEVPPRRVVDGFPIVVDRRPWMACCRDRQGCPGFRRPGRRVPGSLRAKASAGARAGDVDVLLPPVDRDPVHREMPARRHDVPDARHLDGKGPENVPGPPVRKPRDQQVYVPRLPPLDDVPQEPTDEIYRPSGIRDLPGEVPEKPAQGKSAAQRAA